MQFRSDVAGLRAVAILPILLLHAGVSAIPGGFVGVDIFFVISGFLITAILMRDLERQRFSLIGFYRRRAVRILPALLVMLAIVLVAGCLLLFPSDVRELGTNAAATAASVSNILFWRTTSYFDNVPELRPLLHTWSLGVEEQFYLFYPLFLLLARPLFPGRLKPVLAAVAIGSFAFAWFVWSRSASLAFFMLPSRAWELSLGGLVALGAFPALSNPRARDAAALAGLAMIVAGLFVIRASSPFPAPWGLLPCLGTALMIAYGERSVTARLLALPPMQWIGAISYSLYLWHWPILASWRYQFGVALAPWEVALLIAVSVLAGALSYWLIERPFLRRYRTAEPRRAVIVACVAIAAMVAAGLGVAANAAHWRTLDPRVARVVAYADYPQTAAYREQFRPGTCFATIGAWDFDRAKCLAFASDRPNVLLIGDSLAAQMWRPLAERHPRINVMQATASGCMPYLEPTGDAPCVELMRYMLGPLLDARKPDRVVFSAFWWFPYHWQGVDRDMTQLTDTIRAIRARGIPVTVVGPVAEYEDDVPRLVGRVLTSGDRAIFDESEQRGVAAFDRMLAEKVRDAGAEYRSAYAAQCPNGACPYLIDGAPFVFDRHHWTPGAARAIIARMPVF